MDGVHSCTHADDCTDRYFQLGGYVNHIVFGASPNLYLFIVYAEFHIPEQ